MTHFLYTYRDDGQDGAELKYSLRSLERFWAGDLPVITVVGEAPRWLRDAHLVWSVQEPGESTKVRNVLRSMHEASRYLASLGVTEAIYMADDYILTDPIDSVVPTWKSDWDSYYGVRNRLWEPGIEWLTTAMEATNTWVAGRPDAVCYELHRPMPIDPRACARLLERFLLMPVDRAPLWRSLYGNLVGYEKALQAADVRVKPSGQFPAGTPWMSTDQKFWDKIGPKLEQAFPKPSRWEKDS